MTCAPSRDSTAESHHIRSPARAVEQSGSGPLTRSWEGIIATPTTDATRLAADDRAALERMACGDHAALAELYDRQGRLVYSLALRIVRDAGDAEDVTQEVFAQAWHQAGRFQASRGTVAAWLVMLTRTRAIDLWRKRRVRPQLLDEAAPDRSDQAPLQDLRLVTDEQASSIQRALHRLPALQRTAIELAFFDGLTHTEIAAELELPLGTVKTRVRQGLLKLRDHLMGTVS